MKSNQMSNKKGASTVRIGILGAARVAPGGVIRPSRAISGVEVVAVASRSADRAKAYAQKHRLPKWFGSYDELLRDPEIDAIYLALPNSLHLKWSARAAASKKHILCEKPLAENADQAVKMWEAARDNDVVLAEAMHFHYKTVLRRQREIVESGELGAVEFIRSDCAFPWIPMKKNDFRRSFALGGGAALDLGCYAVHNLRYMLDDEPAVTSVSQQTISPNVDRWMSAEFDLENGAKGSVFCGFRGFFRVRFGVTITFANGLVKWSRKGLVYTKAGKTRVEPITEPPTFVSQLEAFVTAVGGGRSALLSPEESIRSLRVIDAMYKESGLLHRGSQNLS
jgi:predicted dehydrogenase